MCGKDETGTSGVRIYQISQGVCQELPGRVSVILAVLLEFTSIPRKLRSAEGLQKS